MPESSLNPESPRSPTAFFAIFSHTEGVIGAASQKGGPTEIREFHGTSTSGWLLGKSEVSSVRSPGGALSSIPVVLGRATIWAE